MHLPAYHSLAWQVSARRSSLVASHNSRTIITRFDPQPKPCMKLQTHDAQRSLPLRRQLRRRAAVRLVQTLSLDAADGLAGDAAAPTAAAVPAGRLRVSSPYAWAALAAAAPGGGGRAAAGGGLRAEVLRAALRRSGASMPTLTGRCGCAAPARART